jgi:hypothetical protein
MTDLPEFCIWKGKEEFNNCVIKDKLICHFHRKYLRNFIGLFCIFVITSFTGVIIAGYGWFLLGWIGFWLFFFEFWEIRILCSHCPYYAEDSKTIHCIANYGSLKLWKYHPEPMNLSEKIQLILGLVILFGYPLIFMILGRQFIFLLISILEIFLFFSFLLIRRCGKCVNFSCPFNRVKKEIVRTFLEKNPEMKKV